LVNLVLLGGGGHAKSVLTVVKKLGQFRVAGYVDPKDRGQLLGVPYLGNDDDLKGLVSRYFLHGAVIGIGNTTLSRVRPALMQFLGTLPLECPTICSPAAVVNEEVRLGKGTVVLDGAVVNSGTTVGDCCIINTQSTVEHDCILGDNIHVAPSALLNGGVLIGNNTLIGAGSIVIQGVRICPDCVIGAGAVVVRDIQDPGTYIGVPARKAK
jgi:sugar O-acyltransferase (sialic acid O-acetyltransferase NeuD family)